MLHRLQVAQSDPQKSLKYIAKTRKRSFAGEAIEGGRRPAIDAGPADIKARNNRLSSKRRAPRVSSSASTRTLREGPARSSPWLALGQQHQVGDFLRYAALMSYPYAGETPMGGDEAARNTVQPSMRRSVSCCASPRQRDAQTRSPLAPPRPRRRPRRATRAMFPSARCCTRWCRRTTRTS